MAETPSQKWNKPVVGWIRTMPASFTDENGKTFRLKAGTHDFIDTVITKDAERFFVCNEWHREDVVLFIPEELVVEEKAYANPPV